MGRIFKREDYAEKLLRINPEGWVDDLVFEYGFLHTCGQAENSIGVRINNEAGGVLTNDDLMAILNMIIAHLRRVADESEETVIDLQLKNPETKKKATLRRKKDSL